MIHYAPVRRALQESIQSPHLMWGLRSGLSSGAGAWPDRAGERIVRFLDPAAAFGLYS
jgi:hypothetical protein